MPAAAAISAVETSAYGFSPNNVIAHCNNCSRRASGSSLRPRDVVTGTSLPCQSCYSSTERAASYAPARAGGARGPAPPTPPLSPPHEPRGVVPPARGAPPATADAQATRVVRHRERQSAALLLRQRLAHPQPGERRPGRPAVGSGE